MQSKVFLLDIILGQRGFSVADLERMSKVPRGTIDDIRKKNGAGRRENVEKLAAALGLEYDDLFKLEGEDELIPLARAPSVDVERLRKIAESYKDDGDEAMYRRLMTSVKKAGISVEANLDNADSMYENNNPDAIKEYTYAFASATPRHLQRMKRSIEKFLSLCEKENNFQSALTLYRKIQEPGFKDYDILFWLGTFFAEQHLETNLITECFDLADQLID